MTTPRGEVPCCASSCSDLGCLGQIMLDVWPHESRLEAAVWCTSCASGWWCPVGGTAQVVSPAPSAPHATRATRSQCSQGLMRRDGPAAAEGVPCGDVRVHDGAGGRYVHGALQRGHLGRDWSEPGHVQRGLCLRPGRLLPRGEQLLEWCHLPRRLLLHGRSEPVGNMRCVGGQLLPRLLVSVRRQPVPCWVQLHGLGGQQGCVPAPTLPAACLGGGGARATARVCWCCGCVPAPTLAAPAAGAHRRV